MDCLLCETLMIRDNRHKLQDAAHCPSCAYELRAPKGYMEASLRKCAGPACEEPLPPYAWGRPQEFHAPRCRQAAYRLRRRSGDLAEVA